MTSRSLSSRIVASLCAACIAIPLNAVIAAPASPARLACDFNAANSWPAAAPVVSGKVQANVSWAPVGSYDTAGSAAQSPALQLSADATGLDKTWTAGLRSGPLPVATGETDLAKLTLAFDLSATAALPVVVTITSLDADGRPTGSLEGRVYPAAADFIHRHVLDLNTLKPVGPGKFSPGDPAIELTFTLDGQIWPAAKNELRVDNVSFAGPAFYVSPAGSDTADGRTEKTAFATPQHAIDLAQPGDIILLGGGTYRGGPSAVTTPDNGGLAPTAAFVRPGTPAAWIVLKNYPGKQPVLTGNAWDIVSAKYGTKSEPDATHTLAYLEIRGLHVRGDADVVKTKFPDTIGKVDPHSNSNGIAVNGYNMKNVPHHIRIADNLVEYCPGVGIGTLETDWVVIENNITRFNSWHTIYGTSGISTLGAANFDPSVNIYKILVRNNVSYRNETYVVCAHDKKMTDGNGIIIDVNQRTVNRPDSTYVGRTLVTGNLSFDNGGSGIHTVRADHVDIINNTVYLNSASKALHYSQIFTYSSKDVRIMNNILVAPVANTASGEKPYPVNRITGPDNQVTFSHNLYFGGNTPPDLGDGDRVGDPRFVNPSRDPKVADFHLRPGSPAIDTGTDQAPALPYLDLSGQKRPQGKAYDIGAYEFPVKN